MRWIARFVSNRDRRAIALAEPELRLYPPTDAPDTLCSWMPRAVHIAQNQDAREKDERRRDAEDLMHRNAKVVATRSAMRRSRVFQQDPGVVVDDVFVTHGITTRRADATQSPARARTR